VVPDNSPSACFSNQISRAHGNFKAVTWLYHCEQ